jgi:predicted ester cyclase
MAMATTDNGAIIRELYDAFNARDLERIKQLNHLDARVVNVAFGVTLDTIEYVSNWLTAFSDAHIEVVNLIAQGDLVAAELIGSGVHSGKLEGPTGSIAPTHRRVEMRFCEFFDVRDGKVAGGRVYLDAATMMRALGLAPETSLRPEARPEAGAEMRH